MREGKVDFSGEFFRVESALQVGWGRPCPVIISALAPVMLKAAGEIADGTVTWMVGPKTLATHIVPRMARAAAAAGRPAPRVCVGLPVCVCDDQQEGRRRASELFQMYAGLPNYARVLAIEGTDPGGVAVCGTEAEVESQLRALAAAGATEFGANPFTLGDNPAASLARTRELLKGLVGKI
jgi:alkanesulfonate monooxygenase SsuD/methylene tetrahydromethanopterin reductase-like flavin-dependent oxidoreductase (luciferase family)